MVNESIILGQTILIVDENLNLKLSGIPIREIYNFKYSSGFQLNQVRNRVSFLPNYCDTIFSVTATNILPRYTINFTKPILAYDKVKSGITMDNPDFSNFTSLLNLKESNNIITIRYAQGSSRYLSLFSKISGKSKSYVLTTQKQCLCGPLISFIGMDEDQFITIVSRSELQILLDIIDPDRLKIEIASKEKFNALTPAEEPSFLVKLLFDF